MLAFLAGALGTSAVWTLLLFKSANTPPLAVEVITDSAGGKDLRITNTSDEFLDISVVTPSWDKNFDLPPRRITRVGCPRPGLKVGTVVEFRVKGYSGCIRTTVH
jgi:hypothetical protein